jgi:DNA (cytosine-5)-methyltransferase 1
MPAAVVDVFCGIGGLTHGFVLEGFNVIAGIDSDDSCRYAYEHNNGCLFVRQDIEETSADQIAALFPKETKKILIGCAPCQPFSKYAQKRKKDQKWKLVDVFASLIEQVQPDIVSMENVPNFMSYDNGRVFRNFVQRLMSSYYTSHYLAYCPAYGIPQNRERFLFFASKFGVVELVPPTHKPKDYVAAKQAIGNLSPLYAGEVDRNDPYHRAAKLSDLNLRRIRASKPGGSWKDWEEDLRTKCHIKDSGKGYRSVYGRMTWNEPSPTITTQAYAYGSGRFGHPEQDRGLSLRECALLQTFPSDYEFVQPDSPIYFRVTGRHIGNAVPVALGCIIAKSIALHLEEYNAKI